MAEPQPTAKKHFAVSHAEGKAGKTPQWTESICAHCDHAAWIYRELKTKDSMEGAIQCHCSTLAITTCDAKLSSFSNTRGAAPMQMTKSTDSLPVLVCSDYAPYTGKR